MSSAAYRNTKHLDHAPQLNGCESPFVDRRMRRRCVTPRYPCRHSNAMLVYQQFELRKWAIVANRLKIPLHAEGLERVHKRRMELR